MKTRLRSKLACKVSVLLVVAGTGAGCNASGTGTSTQSDSEGAAKVSRERLYSGYLPITDLGSTLGYSYATDINNSGVVVGVDRSDASIYPGGANTLGFRWTEAQGMTALPGAGPDTFPTAINDDGVIAGISGLDLSDQWLRAFRYDPRKDSQIQRIAGGTASGVNQAGTVVGYAYFPTGLHMFRATGAGLEELPGPSSPGFTGTTIGFAIDEDGTVVGEAQTTSGELSAARFSDALGIELLDDQPNADGAWKLSSARAISNGTIVGWGYHNGLGRAFRLPTNSDGSFGQVEDLGLPADYQATTSDVVSIATDINRSGVIVGGVYDHWPFWPIDAFVHDQGSVFNLNAFVDPGSGWHLNVAYAVNDLGDVVGLGTHDGQRRAFKLHLPNSMPCPTPSDSCAGPSLRNLQTGSCETESPLANGTACDDQNACTEGDTCQSGACVGAPSQSGACAGVVQLSMPDSPVQLRATQFYAPARSEDGQAAPASPVTFSLPQRIQVTVGSSGNGSASFRYVEPSGSTVVCTYAGGSSELHPQTELDRAKGRAYRLQSCSNGLAAGGEATGVSFTLHVQAGDDQDAAARTTIELSLGKGTCSGSLDTPILPEDSIQIRDAFSWNATQAVPETDEQGRPTLWYALLYLEDREQYQMLDELLIHHSLLPLFDSELTRFSGSCGELHFDGDGQGQFVYALLPGVTYNLIRQFALNPDPVEGDQSLFRVVQLLDIPDLRAESAVGSVSFDALTQAGFYYMNLQVFPADDDSEVHQNPFLNSLRRRVAKVVAKAVRRSVRAIVEGLGAVDRFFAGSVSATIRLTVNNRDPAFLVPGAKKQALTRAWGAGTGQKIVPAGARLEILQWLQIGELTTPFPTAYSGSIGADGTTTLRVAKNRSWRGLCVATINGAAEITSLFTENLVCNFGDLHADNFQHDLDVQVESDDRELHVLSILTDSREYLRTVAGYGQPHRAEVLDGWIADRVGSVNGGSAFTPCFDFPNIGSDYQASILGLYWGAFPTLDVVLGPLLEPLTAVDMILPNQGGSNFDSRGIVAHEYGHFALCSLLYDRGFFNISIAYVAAMRQRMENGSNDPNVDSEGAYINEAFADFFAGQVVGGVNYFTPPNATADPVGPMQYCHGPDQCLDANGADRSTWRGQQQRVASTLQDAFDGHHARGQDQPNDGDLWMTGGPSLSLSTRGYGDAGDERVAVPGSCLESVINNWDNHGELLTDSSFLSGLADTIRDPACGNASWCEACVLFAQHEPGGDTFNNNHDWDICTQAPLNSVLGPPPGNTTNLGGATCLPCPVHQLSVRGACTPCGPNQIRSGTSCLTCAAGSQPVFGQEACCPPGQRAQNGVCAVACNAREVLSNDTCVSCLPAEIIVNNRCEICPPDAPLRLFNSCVADCGVPERCAKEGIGCLRPDANGVCQIDPG